MAKLVYGMNQSLHGYVDHLAGVHSIWISEQLQELGHLR